MIEAMLLRTPVVSTDFLTGPRYLLGESGQRGYLDKESTENSYASTILRALNDILVSKSKKINDAYEFAMKNTDINTNMSIYENIFLKQKNATS